MPVFGKFECVETRLKKKYKYNNINNLKIKLIRLIYQDTLVNIMKKTIIKIIFVFLISLNNFAQAGELKGFVKKNNSIYQFEDFTKVSINTEVAVKYRAEKKEKIKISYTGPSDKKSIGEISLEENQVFSFPEDGKYVLFSHIGMHTIVIEPYNSAALSINFYVSDNDTNKTLFNSWQGKKSKKIEANQEALPKISPVIYSENNFEFKNVDSVKNPPSKRASASSIYKEISGSTVLILGETAIGSGVVIKNKKKPNSNNMISQVLTNYHVIKDQKKIGIIKKPSEMSDEAIENSEIYPVKILRANKNYDLALLEIEHKKIGNFFSGDLKPVKLGKKNNLEVAQKAHAIGHPSGNYWTYTEGVISQIRNNFKWSYSDEWNLKADVIQTQTPINPGNSGGPLINSKYELIGLNSFILEGEGLNYAVSISSIKDFLNGNSSSLADLIRDEQKETKKNKVIKKTKKQSDKKCTLISKVDLYKGRGSDFRDGKDGYKETEIWDCYGGAEADTYKVDTTQDGKTNEIWVDYDDNGHFDYLLEYVFYQGNLHTIVTYFDNTNSMKVVQRGFDFDNDGKVDKWDTS